MIAIEKLERLDLIVCHGDPEGPCPDGVASAIILRDVLPSAEVRFVTHGPQLEELEPRPGMVLCDIAPPASRADEYLAAGVVVLDHHRAARDRMMKLVRAGLGRFADEAMEPGVSGALLAYYHVWKPLAFRGAQRPPNHGREGRGKASVQRFATLAGVRDTWQKADPDWREACEQAEALRFWPWERWPTDPFEDMSLSTAMRERLAIGPVLYEKRLAKARRLHFEGHRFATPGGTRVLVIPTRDTSDVGEIADDVDLVLGFSFAAARGEGRLLVSARSRGAFDCAALARWQGGGGHTRAAGFACNFYLGDPCSQPYYELRSLLGVWEASGAKGKGGADGAV